MSNLIDPNLKHFEFYSHEDIKIVTDIAAYFLAKNPTMEPGAALVAAMQEYTARRKQIIELLPTPDPHAVNQPERELIDSAGGQWKLDTTGLKRLEGGTIAGWTLYRKIR